MMLLQFIILQVIVFGAVIYFLKKIFHGDTNSAIQRLGSAHEEMVQKQLELQQKNEEIDREILKKREEASLIVSKMEAEAAAEARKREDEVLKNARAQAEEIIAKAHHSHEETVKEIESQVSKKMIQFSSEVVRNALNESLILTIHHQLISDFTSKAKEMDLSSAQEENVEFVVRTPIALRKEDNEKIKALLISKLSRVVEFTEVIDADLIAGIAMQCGSLVLDGSFSNMLKESCDLVQTKY